MNAVAKIAFASAILAASAAVQAETFVGLTWGETSNNMRHSSTFHNNLPGVNLDNEIKNSGTWGVRVGQADASSRYYLTYENVSDSYQSTTKMRQENLLGSYDVFLPLGDSTRLFGGGSLGVIKLNQESSGTQRDTNYGYAMGVQAGIAQDLGQHASLEAGYRYLRSNASVEFVPHGESKLGSVDLHSSSQFYLGANYRF
jgi:opacity protein-like surface antigen